MSLDDLRIPLEDIVTATENFAEANVLKRGEDEIVYKGLLHFKSKVWMDVVIWKYSGWVSSYKINTVIDDCYPFRYYRCVASYIGFCDEKGERIIVWEHVANGSLDKYLSDPITLTWSRRLCICVGAALALHYFNPLFNKIFRDYKSFKVLLDEDWGAKVIPRLNLRMSSTVAPDKWTTLGVILLEVLYGRKVTIQDLKQYQTKYHSEEGRLELDDMIDPHLRKQMLPQTLDIFLQTAYDCFRERRYKPEFIFVKMLERLREAFDIQWKHENSSLVESFAHLKIPLTQIEAELQNKPVIIRRLDKPMTTTKDLFEEIDMITNCNHPNLLSLLGFCDEDSEKILVFECDREQNLKNYLSPIKRPNHTWEQSIRISLDIARGLMYLHNKGDSSSMIHQVIQSQSIYLDDKGTAKIANFRIRIRDHHYHDNDDDDDYERNIIRFSSLRQSRRETLRMWLIDDRLVVDVIYYLGLMLILILTEAPNYITEHASKQEGLLDKEKIKSLVDPRMLEEAKPSLPIFWEITCRCLTLDTSGGRPTFEDIIKSLEEALHIQRATTLKLQKLRDMKIPLKNILAATKSFDVSHLIGSGGYGEVYRAELNIESKDEHPNTPSNVAIKRIRSREESAFQDFLAELDVVSKCKHPNIVSLRGFCVEDGEMLLIYELASNGSLENCLENIKMVISFTWAQRLKLCIDIAKGLKYLHTTTEEKKKIIHRDMKSANILLGENWDAKIADFGLSKFHHENQGVSTINTKNVAGTNFYLDPEYARTGRLKRASDIYSMGVVFFEIFSGKLAYHPDYIWKNEKGLAAVARNHFKKGTLKEIIDQKIMEEAYELGFTGKVEPDHDSLDVFSKIAYQCVAKIQAERPEINVILEELEKALHFQENKTKTLEFSFEHIRLGVEDFSNDNCIMKGGYVMLYKGKVQYNNSDKKVIVKRFNHDKNLGDSSLSLEHGFLREFEVLFKYKHENVIGLVGFCKELHEKIIIYENASKRSLDRCLNDTGISWTKRLKICIDIAKGLQFLHGGDEGQDVVIHRDIRSCNILLTKDWKAKICGFEHALIYPTNEEIEYVIDNVEGSRGYSDPSFRETHFLAKESDIYSLGVILFEILCGRLACPEDLKDRSQFLDVLVKCHFQEAPIEELVFGGIKEQIGQNSLATFVSIAFRCLLDDRKERPTARHVVEQLQKALNFQETYEIRVARSRENYKEISTMTKKGIYKQLSKGFLVEDDKQEIIRFLKQTTSNLQQSAQYIQKNADDYHAD